MATAHYRAAAEAIGRLHISAATHRLGALTGSLDEPMHHAAGIERTFASLLNELQACIAPRAREP